VAHAEEALEHNGSLVGLLCAETHRLHRGHLRHAERHTVRVRDMEAEEVPDGHVVQVRGAAHLEAHRELGAPLGRRELKEHLPQADLQVRHRRRSRPLHRCNGDGDGDQQVASAER